MKETEYLLLVHANILITWTNRWMIGACRTDTREDRLSLSAGRKLEK
jgi:hypothetical protein